MAITINIEEANIKEVARQRCLRERNIKPVAELATEMLNTDNEHQILSIAREIISQGKRNEKAKHNEHNVRLIKEHILKNVTSGDALTFKSVYRNIWREYKGNSRIDHDGATYYAILAALDDLTNEGILKRKNVTELTRRGNRSRIDIYIVV